MGGPWLGSFGIDDGNSSENVNFKTNRRFFFKSCGVNSNSLHKTYRSCAGSDSKEVDARAEFLFFLINIVYSFFDLLVALAGRRCFSSYVLMFLLQVSNIFP